MCPLKPITSSDLIRRVRHAGIAGQVQASQVMAAFQHYLASEFPQLEKGEVEPLFVRQKQLVVRSFNPALREAVREREIEIVDYLRQSTGVVIERIFWRA